MKGAKTTLWPAVRWTATNNLYNIHVHVDLTMIYNIQQYSILL